LINKSFIFFYFNYLGLFVPS